MRDALIVFGGLPGTGKTTIGRILAAQIDATYFRVDVIEQAIRTATALAGELGPSGYAVAQALAESNLSIGRPIVADCVNPMMASREGWRAVACRTKSRIFEVEVICTDKDEHRRRLATRTADIPGHALPDWETVNLLSYEPWDRSHLVIDTAVTDPQEACALIVEQLKQSAASSSELEREG